MFEAAVVHIFRGFTELVSELHMSAVHTPSFLDIAKYLIVFLVGPMTAVIAYDYYFPILAGVNFYLVIAICTPILTLTPIHSCLLSFVILVGIGCLIGI